MKTAGLEPQSERRTSIFPLTTGDQRVWLSCFSSLLGVSDTNIISVFGKFYVQI